MRGPAAGVWVDVGRVERAHGLRGGLLVALHGDDPENLLGAPEVQLDGEPGAIPFRVVRSEPARPLADGRARAALWLAGLDDRGQADAWRGAGVAIPESALRPLPEGEFYWRDLLGLRCVTVAGEPLGRVEEIWPTGSNDVLVVGDGRRRVLLPALHSVLVSVDPERGELRVELPPGLLDAE